jgi:hypothetical protein
MPEQLVFLATLSVAPISKTPNLMPIIALNPAPTRRASKSATRSIITLERLKVNRNQIKSRNPIIRDAHHNLRLLNLSLVAEMRPARKAPGFVFSVRRNRARMLVRCRAAGVHPRKRTGVYLYKLGDEDAV